jgi:hypothetical protein
MTENATSGNAFADGGPPAPEDAALRPAGSDLHPADPADDLTANTTAGADDASEVPAPDGPLPAAPPSGDGGAHDRPDALRTMTYGPEAAAAPADTPDDTPTPTASPAD